MQQLVVNEVTSTAPTADLEQPTEVPLNSSTFMFPLCYIMNSPSIGGQSMKICTKERKKMETLGYLLICYCSGSSLILIKKIMILSCRPMEVPLVAEFMRARLRMS